MKKEIVSFVRRGVNITRQNSPTILTATAIVGVVATTIFAIRATAKAKEDIFEEQCDRKGVDLEEIVDKSERGEMSNKEAIDECLSVMFDEGWPDIPKKEIVKLCWKHYIPTAIAGSLTIVCILGSNNILTRRNAALAAALSLSEKALSDFTAKAVENIGEKKVEKIKEEVAKDQIKNNPVQDKEVYLTGKGETLFFDTLSGRYFKGNVEDIRRAIVDLNYELMDSMYVCLNDLYYSIGLKGIELGSDLGWDINRDGRIDVGFVAQKAENEEPCLALVYTVHPRYDESKLM